MVLRRLFGSSAPIAAADSDRPAGGQAAGSETATVRRIVSQLAALPPERRRYVAGFAYVLGRVANADLNVSPEEMALMEKTIMEVADLPEAQAVLIVEIARNQAELYGATEDYLVTRELARTASVHEREKLLRCCFAIGAADQSITAPESAELNEIGRELGFTDAEIRVVRNEFRDQLAAIQQMRRDRPAAGSEPG